MQLWQQSSYEKKYIKKYILEKYSCYVATSLRATVLFYSTTAKPLQQFVTDNESDTTEMLAYPHCKQEYVELRRHKRKTAALTTYGTWQRIRQKNEKSV